MLVITWLTDSGQQRVHGMNQHKNLTIKASLTSKLIEAWENGFLRFQWQMGSFNAIYCLAIMWQLASYQQVARGTASHRKMKNVIWLQNIAANSLEWAQGGRPCEDVSPPFPTRIAVICWHLLATRCTTSADDSSGLVFRNTNSHILFIPNVFRLVLVILP